MNTKKKGTSIEKQVKEILEKQGFVVMNSPRTMRPIGGGKYVSKDCDYFNLFDIVAKNCGWTRWIQVKSTPSGVSSAKKPIMEFHNRYMCDSETSEIWLKVPRKGFMIYVVGLCNNWFQDFVSLKGENGKNDKIH